MLVIIVVNVLDFREEFIHLNEENSAVILRGLE
jgi:hypothetical protein